LDVGQVSSFNFHNFFDRFLFVLTGMNDRVKFYSILVFLEKYFEEFPLRLLYLMVV